MAESEKLRPASSRAVLLVLSMSLSLSTLMPVSWPALFMVSRTREASSAPIPHAAMADWTESIEEETSVLLSCANLTKSPDRFCRASPVRPNLVFTSPTASAAVWKSVGMVVAISLARCCMSSRASPDAPVLVVMVSMASSTSFHAATDAAPTATIGAVTPLVRVSPAPLILPPTSPILLPTSSTFFPASCMDAWKGVGRAFTSSWNFFRASSSAMI